MEVDKQMIKQKITERKCKKKNIAIFCGSLYRGGAEHVTVYLAEGLKRLGYHTVIITCKMKEQEYEVPKDIMRYVLNQKNSIGRTGHMILNLRTILKKNKIDILCVIATPLSVYAIPASIGLKTKIIISERNDPTHFAGRKSTKFLFNWFMKKGDGFVFQTYDAKKYFDKQLKGRGEVIYNPLFTDDMPLPYKGEPEKIIVAVGRLEHQKNHAMLIQAFAECAEINQKYKLVIYGEGVLRSNLEKMIIDSGMEGRIILPGNVPDVCEKIRTASLYILPSDFEGMPNSLIEAMALGLPCISTDCPIGGPSELIQDGINGILIPTGDRESLVEKMKEVLSIPELERKLRKNAVLIKETLAEGKILNLWAKYIEVIADERKH